MLARLMVAACALALVGVAHAQPRPPSVPTATPPPRVLVVDARGDGDTAAIALSLTEAIRREPRLTTISDPAEAAALLGPIEDEDARNATEAEAALRDAEAALARFDGATALAQIEVGVARLLATYPAPLTHSRLADLFFLEGLAHAATGDASRTRQAFAQVHRLVPGRAIDPGRYLPEVVEQYRAAMAPTAPATLRLEGAGTAWVDGQLAGPVPTTVTTTAGVHTVVLAGPEREPRGLRVQVVPGGSEVVRIAEAPASRALQLRRARTQLMVAPDVTARASAIGRMTRLTTATDAFIVTRDPNGQVTVQRWRNRAPGFSPPEAVTEATRLNPSSWLEPLLPLATAPPPPGLPDPPTPRWHQRTWVRASLASGLVLALLGGLLLSDDTPTSRTVRGGTF